VKKFLMAVLVIVVVLLLVILSRPDTYHVERSVVIAAPAEAAFAQVNDFHAWKAWSPWEKMDPQMKWNISDPAAGVGAKYHWEGNDKVGVGEMLITESTPVSHIGFKVDFLKPYTSSFTSGFTFTPGESGTTVRWAMDGKADFMTKAMCLVTPMDKMVGPDFERGLATLKTTTEEAARAAKAAADSTAAAAAASAGAGKKKR
jgi:hypothetical protein